MKSLLVVLMLCIAVQCLEYHYEKPQIDFQREDVTQPASLQQTTNIIKGHNGKDFEVTLSASRKIFEARVPPTEEVFLVKHFNHVSNAYQQPAINTLPDSGFYGQIQQSNNNPQFNSNSNQYNGIPAANNAQQHYNQLTAQRQQYQQQQRLQQQQPYGMFSQNPQQQVGLVDSRAQQHQQLLQPFTLPQGPQQQQQQNLYLPQYEHYLQQSQRSTNLPNANNPPNDLVNNHKYVSQSEASQLDVYSYKEINGNPRPFTRIISKCDFHHQQVLKESKAQVGPSTDKCQNKFNYQFTGNALTGNAAKAQRGIAINKGTDLRDRRLFAYSEVVIPQYPHN